MSKAPSKKVPDLRFLEFKGEWENCRIGEFVKERKVIADKELPLYSLTIENGIVPKSKRYERSFLVKSEEDSYKVMLPDDFAFNPMNLRFGALARYKGDVTIAVSGYYNIFFCEESVSAGYLESFLTSTKQIQFYDRMSTGTLLEKKRVHYLDFIEFKRPFPKPPEQKKIADFLSAVDGRIEGLEKKRDLLKEYKKGLMQQLFSQDLRFMDDNGKPFPDWEQRSFASLYSFESTNSYSRDMLNYEVGSVKNVHYGDIHTKFNAQFEIGNEKVPFINPTVDLSRVRESQYLQEGDLVIADASEDYADIGKSIEVVGLNGEKAVAGLHTILARRKNVGEMAIGFAAYLVQSEDMRLSIKQIAQGTKVLGLSSKRLGEIKMRLPHFDEQKKIADCLSALDRKIESVEAQVSQTREFKKGLLQKMFV